MKLYTLHGIKFYDDDKITAKPATPAEVASAHERCKTCGHFDHKTGHDLGRCQSSKSPYRKAIVDPALDYCRHHSELNKENDDDKT